MFSMPDEGIGRLLYPWANNDGTGGSAVVLFGPGIGDALQERLEAAPLPADMDFYDCLARAIAA